MKTIELPSNRRSRLAIIFVAVLITLTFLLLAAVAASRPAATTSTAVNTVPASRVSVDLIS